MNDPQLPSLPQETPDRIINLDPSNPDYLAIEELKAERDSLSPEKRAEHDQIIHELLGELSLRESIMAGAMADIKRAKGMAKSGKSRAHGSDSLSEEEVAVWATKHGLDFFESEPLDNGFNRMQKGPAYTPEDSDLLGVFQGQIDKPLETLLLQSDQGNTILFANLIPFSKKLSEAANSVQEPEARKRVSHYALSMLKNLADNNQSSLKRADSLERVVYYAGNYGSNNNLVRIYVTNIGAINGVPVFAKVGESRTKAMELEVLKGLGAKNRISKGAVRG